MLRSSPPLLGPPVGLIAALSAEVRAAWSGSLPHSAAITGENRAGNAASDRIRRKLAMMSPSPPMIAADSAMLNNVRAPAPSCEVLKAPRLPLVADAEPRAVSITAPTITVDLCHALALAD